MPSNPAFAERRLLVPEVIQTSALDCGPAVLKCLLEGFGVSASYGRLREACQTDVDGTSIDTLEDVAVQLGLMAEQTIVPVDHLLLPEAQTLPALVVTVLPNGLTHFVVTWNRHGRFVQVMDPSVGRRWLTQTRFLRDVYRHAQVFPAAAWRDWAGSEGFCAPLRRRLAHLELEASGIARLIDAACEDSGWHALAALDAATRMATAIVRAGGLAAGGEAQGLVEQLFQQARQERPEGEHTLPLSFWSVQPLTAVSGGGEPEPDQLLLQGAVLVRVVGRRATPSPVSGPRDGTAERADTIETPTPLAPDLASALQEEPHRAALEIWRILRADGMFTPVVLVLALALAAAGVAGEAVLFRGLMELGSRSGLIGSRLTILGAIFAFSLGLLLLEFPIMAVVSRMGRRLEIRLRMIFLEKLPRLGDRYFHSRLTSDMSQRAHSLRQLRILPHLAARFLRLGFQLILTTGGIVWLAPGSAPIALLASLSAVAMVVLTQPLLAERDMRVRTHVGALSRFYLDALLGLVPVRTHRAERALRRDHESLLVEWVRASLAFYRVETIVECLVVLSGSGFAIWILHAYVTQGGDASDMLLLLYWTLHLPMLGQFLLDIAKQYPIQRNHVLRLLETLSAPDEEVIVPQAVCHEGTEPRPETTAGVAISMQEVGVQAGGHRILHEINLAIRAGEHLAIVGSSGAGKSSLVGLLLGWHRVAAGCILVDGIELTGERLHALRRSIAWVDPAVHLWNRSLLDNLHYGSHGTPTIPMSDMLDQTDLIEIVEQLPDGLQTRLGEGGGLVSGGEGQRVRLGRALWRPEVRLVILDEPFRGLDGAKRQQLLARARGHWHAATLICVTHDISATQGFARVVVIENGRIVEDAVPDFLATQPDSRYRALLDAAAAVQQGMWQRAEWRRLWLEQGQLRER